MQDYIAARKVVLCSHRFQRKELEPTYGNLQCLWIKIQQKGDTILF